MFILATFLTAAAKVLDSVLTIYLYIVIARALISWVNPDPYNPIVRFLSRVTDPVLNRVRRVLPYMGGIDLSPIVVILAIYFLREFLVQSMFILATRM